MANALQQKNFLDRIVPIAQQQAKKHGGKIFASICVAQAIHESGWGTAPKMANANAVFGIKVGKSAYRFGTAWKGEAYKTGTTEYYDGKNATKIVDWFRKYNSLSDSVEDYFDMLCSCTRYKGALNSGSPEKCITAIIAGGYATGPEYVEKIKELLKLYNLKQYDSTSVSDDQSKQNVPEYAAGKQYTTQVELKVRIGPGTNFAAKGYTGLTEDGKKHDKDHDGAIEAGTIVSCLEVKKIGANIWIRTPSGYLAAYFNGKIFIK